MPKGAVILPSYYEAIKDLPDTDRLKMYDCLVRYGLYGEIVELPAHLMGFFTLIRPTMDSGKSRYEAACINGNKGGRPRKNQNQNQNDNQNQNQNSNQDYDYDLDSDYEKEKDDDTDEGKEGFGGNGEPICGVQILDSLSESDEDRLDRLRSTALDKLDKYMQR